MLIMYGIWGDKSHGTEIFSESNIATGCGNIRLQTIRFFYYFKATIVRTRNIQFCNRLLQNYIHCPVADIPIRHRTSVGRQAILIHN